MKKPKVVLKKIITFVGMEGHGFNADIWINGVKCLLARDAGDGGEMDFDPYSNDEKVKHNVQLLDDYIKTLPPLEYTYDGKKLNLEMTRALYVDVLLEEHENNKNKKKFDKICKTSIVIGVPNDDKYSYLNYKKPLSELPINVLQLYVDNVRKKYCKDGVVILNTNLKELGVE
jgi:hypothetical protein